MFNANDMVNIQDLAAMNDALRKATSVGYQDGSGVVDANGSLSALVPQSIEGTLSTATYSMKELALWPAIAKRNVTNTLHEFVRIDEHGFDMDPFLSEGGGGARNVPSYSRESVKIKYLAERREVSDVGSLVGIIGNSANAIAEETTRGTFALLGRLERALWHGDESANPLAFNGVIKQIESHDSGANVYDLEGNAPTPQLLQDVLGEIYAAPRYGRPDCIYVEPRIHAELIRFAVQFGRHDQLQVMSSAQGITYGTQQITIMGPVGPVTVKPAPFLADSFEPPAAAYTADGSAFAAPTLAFTLNPNTASKMTIGSFKYKAVVVTPERGYSDASTELVVAATLGQEAVITITHGGIVGGTLNGSSNSYVRIYRTKAGGSKFFKIAELPCGNGSTVFTDLNQSRPGTSKIVFIQHSPDILEFARLLDFFRRPLAEVATSKPFLLMLFGSPIVKVPSKCWVIKNASVQTTDDSLLTYRA
ncbi:MAG: hypothetical protein CML17_08740 [Pusillimonas sp.]|nr:hypothetical protein [Pusillimonas sp.]